MRRRSLAARWGLAALRALVLLYPAAFRRRFGPSMREALADRVDAAERRGRVALAVALVRAAVDAVGSAVLERLDPTLPNHATEASLVDGLRQDLTFAARSLLRRPGFTLVAVATLALGIGANAAIFSVINAVLLKPLPYPGAEELVMVWAHDVDEPDLRGWMSRPDLEDVRELAGIEAITGYGTASLTLTGGDRPEVVAGGRTTGDLLRTFGLTPALGRDLPPEGVGPDAPLEVVLGYDLWQERYGGDPGVLGRPMEIAERSYTIVGVAPAGFDFPDGARAWVGDRNSGSPGCQRGCHTLRAVARLAAGVAPSAVADELEALGASLGERFPDSNFSKRFHTEDLAEFVVGDVRTGLWLVLGAVGMVLLIACANVANLLLVRASSRRTEVAVRAALGAGRGRLARQVLTESLLLAALGAGAGLLLAKGALGGIVAVAAGTVPRIEGVGVDATVLGFTGGLTVLVALLFGLSPALQLARTSVSAELGSGGRGGAPRRESRSRSTLLAVEVGVSLVLLVGAGLLLRSFQQLWAVDLGYETREVARFQLVLPDARYPDLPAVTAFYGTLEERLANLPGVEAVGSAFGAPLGNTSATGDVLVDGRPEPGPGEGLHADIVTVTPGFMETLRVPLLRGRAILPSDDRTSRPVAVVNEAFVREIFPGEEVLGQRVHVTVGFGYGDFQGERQPMWEIVGVLADVRGGGPRSEASPEIWVPHAQYGPDFMDVHLRGAPGATGVIAAAREVVESIDSNVPLRRVETLEEAVAEQAAPTRFYLLLVALFAGVASLLACVGLYGVVAYLVARRTREIGIRMALGARRSEIASLVVAQGLRPAAWGVGVGLLVAVAGGRVVESVLFGVRPSDPFVLAGVTVLVVAMVVVASVVPARRALSVDPARALREE